MARCVLRSPSKSLRQFKNFELDKSTYERRGKKLYTRAERHKTCNLYRKSLKKNNRGSRLYELEASRCTFYCFHQGYVCSGEIASGVEINAKEPKSRNRRGISAAPLYWQCSARSCNIVYILRREAVRSETRCFFFIYYFSVDS